MIVHPDLRALRSDTAPQRDAQDRLFAAVSRWRHDPAIAAPLADMARFAEGHALADCAALATLFDERCQTASRLAQAFAAVGAKALVEAPLAYFPMRHFSDGVVSTLLLAHHGAATLSLVAIDGAGLAARPPATAVDFRPSDVVERVLAGSADAERVTLHPRDERSARLDRERFSLAPGQVIRRDGAREALILGGIDRCLVKLRLQRRRAGEGPTREYALADGSLLHQAASSARDSRLELMMALLRRMERADAAPHLAGLAREPGSMALRWQALRECLALDTLSGFRVLAAIAAAPNDPLASMAGAVRAQLIEAHPQLQELEPCPA
jgi:hypothetical protein